MTELKLKSVVGANTSDVERADADYYATPYSATRLFLENFTEASKLKNASFLEPCYGGGHILQILMEKFPRAQFFGTDIANYGWNDPRANLLPNVNFLTHDFGGQTFDCVITNPPFSCVNEFIVKCLQLANKYVCIHSKIMLLETESRHGLIYQNKPLKHVFVHKRRTGGWRNGEEFNKDGKEWSKIMCHAWYVWEMGYKGKPMISWI